MEDGECNRCGKCCFIPTGEKVDGVFKLKACKYLIKISENRYSCRIYRSRLGVKIGEYKGKPVHCRMYNSQVAEIVGCPLNKPTGQKPRYNVEIKGKFAEMVRAKNG